MQELIKISSKGQVVIPKSIREKAGWNPGDQLIAEWMGDHLEFRKAQYTNKRPEESLVRELLGKYQEKDAENHTAPNTTIRNLRKTLYGKIDS